MVQFIYGLFVCAASLQGPCSMVQGPYATKLDCQARLAAMADASNLKIEHGMLKSEGQVFLCMKRPVSSWTPADERLSGGHIRLSGA